MERLLEQLHFQFAKSEIDVEEVRLCIARYVQEGNTDWMKYRMFAPCKYARNLVDISMDFEAIVICWDENQESPIHNHTAQNCWFAVLEGNVEEVYYSYDSEAKKVTEGTRFCHRQADVGWIKDDVALHKVGSTGGKACTLHVYSKPIPFCNIYDPATGEVNTRKSGFYSVRGLKQDPETTSLISSIYSEIEALIPSDLTDSNHSIPCKTAPSLLFDLPLRAEGEEQVSNEEPGSQIFGGSGSIFSLVTESFTGKGTKEEFSW
uniref:Cysteine dioxygenase n=1 Tax=Arcella intermedia TaxID=1963864 RepID=A0A6B2LEQ0_9EUKA